MHSVLQDGREARAISKTEEIQNLWTNNFKIYGAVEVAEVWRVRCNYKLHNPFKELDIVVTIKAPIMRRPEHVLWMDETPILNDSCLLNPGVTAKNGDQSTMLGSCNRRPGKWCYELNKNQRPSKTAENYRRSEVPLKTSWTADDNCSRFHSDKCSVWRSTLRPCVALNVHINVLENTLSPSSVSILKMETPCSSGT
jgi:hypothetical protein